MGGSSFREGRPSLGLRGAAGAALAASLLWAFPSAALEDGDAEGMQKAGLEGVVVKPVDPAKPAGKPVVVILGETEESRRELVVALPVGAGARSSALSAEAGTQEVRAYLTGQAERYDAWVRGRLHDESTATPGGVIVLAQTVSGLEVSCPREVSAGEKVTLEVTSVGETDDAWRAWLVYPGEGATPDGSRYEEQTLKAGARTGGAKKLTAAFTTFPADRGRLLGVCVERHEGGEKRCLWVQVR